MPAILFENHSDTSVKLDTYLKYRESTCNAQMESVKLDLCNILVPGILLFAFLEVSFLFGCQLQSLKLSHCRF